MPQFDLSSLVGLPGVSEINGEASSESASFAPLCLLSSGIDFDSSVLLTYGPPCSGSTLTARASPGLLHCLSKAFVSFLSRQAPEPSRRVGLESLLVNDPLASRQWACAAAWSWQERVHINLLETRAALKAIRDLVVQGGDIRYVHVVDSSVL